MEVRKQAAIFKRLGRLGTVSPSQSVYFGTGQFRDRRSPKSEGAVCYGAWKGTLELYGSLSRPSWMCWENRWPIDRERRVTSTGTESVMD